MLHLYADGSYRPPTHGGYAYLILNDKRDDIIKIQYGYVPNGTNNSAELTAIFMGLEDALRRRSHVCIYSDSKYCIDSLTVYRHIWKRNGWLTSLGKPVSNADLIKKIGVLLDTSGAKITFQKVKGHAGDPYNTVCDYWAKKVTREARDDEFHDKRKFKKKCVTSPPSAPLPSESKTTDAS